MPSSSFKVISIMGMTSPVFKKSPLHVGFVTNVCNLSTWKAEAGRAWFVQGQPGLWIETLPQNEGMGRESILW